MRKREDGLMRFGGKSLATVIALALILCCTIGGTLAYLFDKSEPVTNTFTYGDIEIQLNETDPESNNKPEDNTYSMDISNIDNGIVKDPTAVVLADSEKCWLFVKVKESDNFDRFLTYTVPTGEGGWKLYKEVSASESIYYRVVPNANIDQSFGVLENDRVYLKTDVTQKMLDAMELEQFPTLTINAYAVQYDNISDVDEAWVKCPEN